MRGRGARGEGTLTTADGDEVRVLYTNRALAEAEQAMGKSVLAVAQGFADGDSGIGDMAALLQAGMEAARHDGREGGRRVAVNDAFEVMDAVGFAGVATVVMEAVSDVLSYDPASSESELGSSNNEDADPNA